MNSDNEEMVNMKFEMIVDFSLFIKIFMDRFIHQKNSKGVC